MIYCLRHADVRGNKRVDALAGEASVDGTVMIRDRTSLMRTEQF